MEGFWHFWRGLFVSLGQRKRAEAKSMVARVQRARNRKTSPYSSQGCTSLCLRDFFTVGGFTKTKTASY
jgi:hypothetical protein